MAIKSRAELEHSAIQNSERGYETRLFNEAMKSIPNLKPSQSQLFLSDTDLKDSYFADLQNDDKQKLFAEKLGTDVLEVFRSNKNLHMLRNSAVHTLISKGVSAPNGSALLGTSLDVTNKKEFSASGERKGEINVSDRSLDRVAKLDEFQEALQNRRVEADEFGTRTHSVGDKQNKTLYFNGKQDVFDFEAPSSFTYDDVEMGCAMQGVLYEQAKRLKDPKQALALSKEPMDSAALLKNGFKTRRYTTEKDMEEWSAIKEDVMYNVLKARYEQDSVAKEALVKSAGYRLAYASTNSELGIGYSVDNVRVAQEAATKDNESITLKEQNPDSNNLLGRITEQIRREIITPVVEKAPSQNPYTNKQQSSNSAPPVPDELAGAKTYSSNPFGKSTNTPQNEDLRSMNFLDDDPYDSYSYSQETPMENETTSNPYDAIENYGDGTYNPNDPNQSIENYGQMEPMSTDPSISIEGYEKAPSLTPVKSNANPFNKNKPLKQSTVVKEAPPKPLEMSIHSSQEISRNASMRAYEAVKLFGLEAKEQNREAVVYVSHIAHGDLKKAVFANRDTVRMEKLNRDHVPERSLIVQHSRAIDNSFRQELLFATSDSDKRDVRALLPDPEELDQYSLNEFLVMESEKVTVRYQNDGIGQDKSKSAVSEPLKSNRNPFTKSTSNTASDTDKKAAMRMNQDHTAKAQEQARRQVDHSKNDIKKGVYAADPFQ